MTETADAASPARTMASAVLGVALIIALGVAQLAWLDRTDQIGGFLGTFAGPLVGVLVGSWIATKRRRSKRPRRHSPLWHVGWGLVVVGAWLVFVTASNGGLSADMTVPTVVLTVVGATAFGVATKVVTPELVL
jgi:hypothetical protein